MDDKYGDPIVNTRAMSLRPEPADEYAGLDEIPTGAGMTLLPVFSGAAFLRHVNYPVIVEMWEKRKAGRVRRRWEAEFTPAERNSIARQYAKFYRWHLVTGTPEKVSLQLRTLQLLQRAVAFFATV